MKKRITLALIALLAGFQIMTAVPARPGRFVYTQPDGTMVVLQRHGDEFGHWTTDGAGRLVSQSPDGFYRPASGITVDEIRRNAAVRRAAARRNRAIRRASGTSLALGKKHYLVILVEFTNCKFTTSSNPQSAFTDLLNKKGYAANGGTGSARDYYYDNSQGLFEPVFDVYGPVRLDTTYAYYGQNDWSGNDKRPEEALIDGCKKLDGEIDFSRYDNDGDGKVDLVFMYYAGKGEADGGSTNTIWPHQWELGSAGKSLMLDGMVIDSYACTNEVEGSGAYAGKMCGIGSACHEFGHAVGLPDLYDTDYEDNGEAGGLYSYSPMSGGSYNNDSRTPPYFCFEERIFLGWLEESDYLEFGKTGSYTLPPINENVAYRTFTDMDGEYFIYENRSKTGWDAYLPGEGLVVYHADKSSRRVTLYNGATTAHDLWYNWEQYNSINENGSHPCFYIVPAASQGSLNYSYESRIPFPYQHVTSYVPMSWNGVEGDITFSDIARSPGLVTLKATVPSDEPDYCTIADAGSYRAGERFTFALVRPEAVAAPVSVVWYYDDEPAGADSVTLTAGYHTVEARLAYSGGRQEVLTLEIEVN